MPRWQYLAHVEPLATTRYGDGSEQADRWDPCLPVPGPARRLSAAILAGACFLVALPPVVAPVSAWMPPLATPVCVEARLAPGIETFAPIVTPAPVVVVTLDTWYVALATPPRVAQPLVVGETIAPLHVVQRPPIDRWGVPLALPPRGYRPLVQGEAIAPLHVVVRPALDRWQVPLSEPVRRVRRCDTGWDVFAPTLTIAAPFQVAWAEEANSYRRRGVTR